MNSHVFVDFVVEFAMLEEAKMDQEVETEL